MLNIMIVDDSMIIRKTLTKVLTQMGHNVVGEAQNGKEAVALYSSLNPDLVTMDITMPVMNGIEALKEIKKKHQDVVAIMITSHGEEKLVMDSIKSGAKGYVLKPISEDNVAAAIKKAFPNL